MKSSVANVSLPFLQTGGQKRFRPMGFKLDQTRESTVGICTKNSVQCNIAHRQDLGNKTRVVSKFRTRQLDI